MLSPESLSVRALKVLQNSMMFTPCWPSAGPTGGAGVAAPALIWSLTIAESFRFLGGISCSLVLLSAQPGGRRGPTCRGRMSDLGDLGEGELDRSLPAEDRNQDLDLLGVDVDLADRRRQRRERAVHHGDRLADLEVDLGRSLGAGGPRSTRSTRARRSGLRGLGARQQELQDLVDRQRRRLGGGSHEAGDPGGVAHGSPRLVVELHADQDVAGQDLALHLLAL